eukprot:7026996-Pyramimonas_sp.AAC.1
MSMGFCTLNSGLVTSTSSFSWKPVHRLDSSSALGDSVCSVHAMFSRACPGYPTDQSDHAPSPDRPIGSAAGGCSLDVLWIFSHLVHGDAPLLGEGAARELLGAGGLHQRLQGLEAEALALEGVLQAVVHDGLLHAEQVVVLHVFARLPQQVVVVLLRHIPRGLRRHQL